MSMDLSFALPEAAAARRAFDRAAQTFEAACFVHDEARERLLERLDFLRLEPQTIVDIGCATGRGAAALAARYPAARVLAIDSSRRMCRVAARNPGVEVVHAEAQRLPLRARSVHLLFANLVMPWCRPEALFAEAARVLAPDGLLLFATLGPDTLAEVRRAFAGVDDRIHVHALYDMHDLGDLAMAAGLAEPVLDVDRLAVTYADTQALVADLRGVGAVNVAGGRRRGLTGRARWRHFEARLNPPEGGRFGVTAEIILGQGWGRGQPARPARSGATEIAVPVTSIRRPSEST